MSDTYVAIWDVDPGANLHSLILLAEPALRTMLEAAGVTLTADPVWTLHADRLIATAPARRACPWDDPTGPHALLLDMMPDLGELSESGWWAK